MTKYNYMEAVKEDVKNYIDSEINFEDFDSLEELEEKLNDELWTEAIGKHITGGQNNVR